MPRILIFLLGLLLTSCSRTETFDPRSIETDAGAALFRRILQDCPHSTDDRKMCLTLGPGQLPPSEEFLGRFPDLKSRILRHNQVTVTNIGGKSVVQEKSTPDSVLAGHLIILLQISELKSAGGNYEAVGAWAYKDEMMRRRYTVSPEPDGKFKIEPGEILEQKPVPTAAPKQ